MIETHREGDKRWPVSDRILIRQWHLDEVVRAGRTRLAAVLIRQIARLYEEARERIRPKLPM